MRIILKYHSPASDEVQSENKHPRVSLPLPYTVYRYTILASIFLLKNLSSVFANSSLSRSIKLTHFSSNPRLPRPPWRHLPRGIHRPFFRLVIQSTSPSNSRLQIPIKRLQQRPHKTHQHRVAHWILVTGILSSLSRLALRATAEEMLGFISHKLGYGGQHSCYHGCPKEWQKKKRK